MTTMQTQVMQRKIVSVSGAFASCCCSFIYKYSNNKMPLQQYQNCPQQYSAGGARHPPTPIPNRPISPIGRLPNQSRANPTQIIHFHYNSPDNSLQPIYRVSRAAKIMSETSDYLITLSNAKKRDRKSSLHLPESSPESHVIIYERGKKEISHIYLVPTFTRMIINRISSIDLSSTEASIGVRLYFTMRYSGIPEKYLKGLLNNIVIILNDSEHLSFCMNEERQFESYQNHEEKTATFITTMKLPGTLKSRIFLAPFERLHLTISMNVLPYFLQEKDPETSITSIVGFRFNQLMNHKIQKMLTVTNKYSRLQNGEYALADNSNYLSVTITDSDGKQEMNSTYQEDVMEDESDITKEKDTKFKEANLIKFECMFYRLPSVAISTIFIPLWVMGFITIGIFFMSSNVDARLTFAATVYVSFAAYFQVIRGALPKSPTITLMEILVYAIIGICVLGTFRTLSLKNYHYDPWRDPLFIISLILLLGSMMIILGGFVFYKMVLERDYRAVSKENATKISTKIRFEEWENVELRESLLNFKYDLTYAETKKGISKAGSILGSSLDPPKPRASRGKEPQPVI